ncbi:hopanoid biosynthesis-associated protein HpnK [Scytonema sp. NUACC26]|uniref:hopanoid biosynthesis-associated protein HpnK n=1 Tax=Scytonema sp. NUACC26 TaxID=3140176 RepID=UPI0034DC9430
MQAQRFAIINGDDFGLSSGVNQAIIKAHKEGVLTSTSLMVTGEAFDEAVSLARTHPSLAVGLHLVLVCGRAALPPDQISHLVDSTGNFPYSPSISGLRYQFNRLTHEELRREIRAQLEKFRSSGLHLSHVDGHLHMHVHPVVLRILVELAREFNIRVIRLPYEELGMTLRLDRHHLLTKLVWTGVFGGLRRYGEGLLKSKGIAFVERVYGLLQTGSMTEEYLLGLIPQIKADLVEIYSHPAQAMSKSLNDPPETGEVELTALLSGQLKEMLATKGFELTNFDKALLERKKL